MEFSKVTRPFSCSLCSLSFTSKQFLQRHMTSHSDIREFSCQICSKTYKYKKGLNRHIKKSHNIDSLENKYSIRKQFKVEDYLNLPGQDRYSPRKIVDINTGKEKEVLFICYSRSMQKKIDNF
jgi:uncharacterized Zn-finger protein